MIAQEIFSPQIFLRMLGKDDATIDYLNWLHDPEINQYLEVRFDCPKKIDDLRSFIVKENSSNNSIMFGIFLVSEGKHIGNIKLSSINWNHKVGQIGILIGEKNEWGYGYATKAIQLITDYAFKELKLEKINACCYENNIGSKNAFLRAGYSVEGIQISQWIFGGKRVGGVLLGMVKQDSVMQNF